MHSPTRNNYLTVGALIIYLIFVKAYITFNAAEFRSVQQAKVFDWPFIALWLSLGLAGTYFSMKSKIHKSINLSRETCAILTIFIGFIFGFLSIANDQWNHWTEYVARELSIPSIHISFPQSLIIYPAGAIVHELFNRLFLVSFSFWLIGVVILKGKNENLIFLFIAVLTSLIEPAGDLRLPFGWLVVLATFSLDFLLNMTEAYLFRWCGFLFAICCRIAFYLVWHVAYGIVLN